MDRKYIASQKNRNKFFVFNKVINLEAANDNLANNSYQMEVKIVSSYKKNSFLYKPSERNIPQKINCLDFITRNLKLAEDELKLELVDT